MPVSELHACLRRGVGVVNDKIRAEEVVMATESKGNERERERTEPTTAWSYNQCERSGVVGRKI